jgi:integrase
MKGRGVGRIYQRKGGTWWIQYSHRGKLHRESSGSKVQRDAASLLKKRLAEMGGGRLLGPDIERTTFEDLAAMIKSDYIVNGRRSLDRAMLAVAHLRERFGRDRAIDITPDRVSSYIVDRLATAKPATIRCELATLGRMFTLGVRAGKASHKPSFPSIEVRNTRQGFFEPAELRTVIAELPPHLRPLIAFARLTGWRSGEIRSLQWRHVDFLAETVRLEPGTTKNDEGRTFPFGAFPELRQLLKDQRERTSALERERGTLIPWVFHRYGKPIQSFHAAWRNACTRAKVPGRLVHDLRRTAVRNLERACVPRSVAMKLTGHKTESIYRRYAIVSEADLNEGVSKLAASGESNEVRRVVTLASAANPRTSTEQAHFGGDRDES